MYRSVLPILAAVLFGLAAATAAGALEKGPIGGDYCERERQQCLERCRGEPLCVSHCTQYPCGNRFPLSGTATQGTSGSGAPLKASPTTTTKTPQIAPAQ